MAHMALLLARLKPTGQNIASLSSFLPDAGHVEGDPALAIITRSPQT